MTRVNFSLLFLEGNRFIKYAVSVLTSPRNLHRKSERKKIMKVELNKLERIVCVQLFNHFRCLADVQKDMPGCSSDRAEPSDQQAVFTCTRNTRHIQCLCCYEYMPDRSNERLQNPAIPPQKCEYLLDVGGSLIPEMYFCQV